MRKTLEERFWSKVDKSGGPDACWLWTAEDRTPEGYGRIRIGGRKGKKYLAHRVAFTLAGGAIDFGAKAGSGGDDVLRHTCDAPGCVNPAHLRVGTQVQNMRDMYERGRGVKTRGEAHPKAKLTERDINEIRSSALSSVKLGKKFGVCSSTILQILHGKSWAYLEEAA